MNGSAGPEQVPRQPAGRLHRGHRARVRPGGTTGGLHTEGFPINGGHRSPHRASFAVHAGRHGWIRTLAPSRRCLGGRFPWFCCRRAGELPPDAIALAATGGRGFDFRRSLEDVCRHGAVALLPSAEAWQAAARAQRFATLPGVATRRVVAARAWSASCRVGRRSGRLGAGDSAIDFCAALPAGQHGARMVRQRLARNFC